MLVNFSNRHKSFSLLRKPSVVANHVAGEEVCNEEEAGPPGWLAVPTSLHDPHDNPGSVARSRHRIPTGHLLHHFLVAKGGVGVGLVGVEHLPLEDPKAPDVRGRGEDPLGDTLGRHPANGGWSPRAGHIEHALAWNFSHKTKIGNLA